jgi:hypothetical protein
MSNLLKMLGKCFQESRIDFLQALATEDQIALTLEGWPSGLRHRS